MRDYGKVHTTFWSSTTTRSLSEDGRALAIYLLTSPHSTITGVFRLPDGYVCDDMQWSSERVAEGFKELFRKGFANRCETTKWVWISKHLKWNQPENPNQRKSAAKLALSIPDECVWKADFIEEWGEFLGIEWKPFPNPSETVPEPFLNQEQEQEQKQEQKQEQEAGGKSLAPAVAAAGRANFAKDEPNPLNLETWQSYRQAYTERYGVPPVRDAATNTKIKAIVKALGAEAPAVAAFFVRHNGARYVGGMHQVGFLATDYAKLRTEWATQTQMTSAKAQQADRTATNHDSFAPLIAEARAREEAERRSHA